ncbi:MAG TPA: hypothetical protein VMN04_11845 [Thermoanaerobaculia bacterium]|nr:hypothetical protein [Thermoanaerobaculia bacterium]
MKKSLAFAFAALALLAGTASCRRVEETRSLNFDPETTAGALGAGWDGFEKTDLGDTFVWAHGREAHLVVRSRADGDRLVRFRCWPFGFPGGPAQTLTFFVNDHKIETLTLGGEPRVYSIPTPRSAWKNGVNELKFLFAYAESPKDRIPGAEDQRTLSAAFDWLEILPPLPAKK